MNAAEHIVQSFFWQAESPKKPKGRRYLTISNVMGGNNKEIDVLAVSGDGQDRLRVEVHVDVGWPLSENYNNYLKNDCIKKKMLDCEHTKKVIREDFGWSDESYRKVLVVWQNPFDPAALRADLGNDTVECWSITDLLQDLLQTIRNSNYQDDVLRLMAMMSSMLCMKGALSRCDCKPISDKVNNISALDCVDAVAALAKKCAIDCGVKTVKDTHVEKAIKRIYEIADGIVDS